MSNTVGQAIYAAAKTEAKTIATSCAGHWLDEPSTSPYFHRVCLTCVVLSERRLQKTVAHAQRTLAYGGLRSLLAIPYSGYINRCAPRCRCPLSTSRAQTLKANLFKKPYTTSYRLCFHITQSANPRTLQYRAHLNSTYQKLPISTPIIHHEILRHHYSPLHNPRDCITRTSTNRSPKPCKSRTGNRHPRRRYPPRPRIEAQEAQDQQRRQEQY